MDRRTEAVRELYERYPYPSGSPTMRVGFDARFVLSRGRLARPEARPLEVLDAGCGRALGLIAAAELQPDVQFLGVDLNRPALEEARNAAKARGLDNVRFQEVDLETLDGLPTPPGGFDVIVSSGVIHHLTDPGAGLRRIQSALAPHGMIVLMVYGALGRRGYEQVRGTIDALVPADAPLEARLKDGRALAECIAGQAPSSPWAEAAGLDDVEFVDRYLHIQEQTYTVPAFFDLIDGAGLSFLAWCRPEAWSLVENFFPGPLRELARGLDEKARASLIEQLVLPRALEAYICHPENGPRPRLEARDVTRTRFVVNPEVSFELVTRPLLSGLRVEAVRLRYTDRRVVPIPNGPLSTAALLLRDQIEPFSGQEFVDALAEQGVPNEKAGGVLFELLHRGAIYRPHPVDVEPTTMINTPRVAEA